MAKDGRETYLSTYLDQASQGIKTLSERDRTAMKIFHKRIRENGVYFLVDNLAATTSTEEIENLNVYQEGFLRPPYETITLALDALNTGGTTTPTLVFIDCFSGGEGAFFYYSTRYDNDRWSVPNVFWYMPFDGSMFRPTPTELRSEGKWQVDFRPKYMLKDHVDDILAKDGMTKKEFLDKHAKFSMKVFVNYACFCDVLNKFHTEFEDVEPNPATNKMRRARGKMPLFTHKTLTIGKKKRKSQYMGGTHASPRSHLRRGYYRTSQKGVRHWVQPCMVKGETDGFVHKDYKVEGAQA
jgi:hypothetical protein